MYMTTTLCSKSPRISPRFVLVLLALAGLCLTGCSNRMAIMQENQANLQILVQENARQMSGLVTCMEQNQKDLQVTIQDLRQTTQTLSEDMTGAAKAHGDLKTSVQQGHAMLTGRVDRVEEDQKALNQELSQTAQKRQILAASIASETARRLALEQEVQDNKAVFLSKLSGMQDSQVTLQSELKSLRTTIQTAVIEIKTVAAAQATLEETLNQSVAGQIASMQEIQSQQQTQLKYSQAQIDKLVDGLSGLETNLTQLEHILKEDISNLSKAVVLANSKLEGQTELTTRVADVQTNTHSMIESLRADLAQVKTVVSEVTPIDMNEPEELVSDTTEP